MEVDIRRQKLSFIGWFNGSRDLGLDSPKVDISCPFYTYENWLPICVSLLRKSTSGIGFPNPNFFNFRDSLLCEFFQILQSPHSVDSNHG